MGNEFDDFAVRRNGTYNQYAYELCRDELFLAKKPAKGGRKSVAANTPTRPVFDDRSPNNSTTREVRVSSAKVAHTNAKLCKQVAGHANHPRLEVRLSFATPGGRKEFRVKNAVADSGAQPLSRPAS